MRNLIGLGMEQAPSKLAQVVQAQILTVPVEGEWVKWSDDTKNIRENNHF